MGFPPEPIEGSIGGTHRITEVDGLRVVTERVPGVRSVSVGAWIGVGSRHEDAARAGYAHFLEHVLFKGNERIDAEAISRHFDGIGSDANAATTREYTVVHARVLDRHLPDTLDVLGEMVLAPAMAADDVDSEREVILEEIAMYDDSPSDVVHELADHLVFPGHELGRPIVGSAQTVRDAGGEDLARFHREHYDPAQMVVSAAGAVDHDAFAAQVRERFLAKGTGGAATGTGRATRPPGADTAAAAPPDRVPGVHLPTSAIRGKEAEQAHLVLAGRGIARLDERRYAAALLDTILGNAPSSRLFVEVRERRGLAYSVYSFLASYVDAGQAGVYVGVRPDRVQTVLEVVREELQRMVDTPPSAAELELAKGHLEGRMLLSLESTTVRSNRLGASLVTGMPIETLETTVDRIRAVDADDVQALASEIFDPARMSFAAVAEDVDAVRDAAAAAGLADVVAAAGADA